MASTHFLVKRDDLRATRVAEAETPAPEPGQALLRVERFGLTANNVTYAVMGDAMSYWRFFPAGDDWGAVPMWGFAEVEASEADGVAVGRRVYGYLPPSTHLVITPDRVGEHGFADGAEHRRELPRAYQQYSFVDADPFYRAETEDVQMLLRPLFVTSWLIDDQLADDGLIERGPILVSSASSKTALGVAFLLAQRGGIDLVALTSERSAPIVERLGIYSRVVTYDAIAELERGPATYVDVAGDADVRRAVHERFGDELAYSMAVGLARWENLGGGEGLPGPRPTLFFAPDRAAKRSADWGNADLQRRAADSWHPFCDWVASWLQVEHGEGFDALGKAWLDVLEGRVPPDRAHVLAPG